MSEPHDLPRAVALEYDGEHAPIVTATGEGQLAMDIMDIARQSGVPLYENADLAQLLSTLSRGEGVPRELFFAVAQVIALAFELEGKLPPGWVATEQGYEREVGE